MHDPVSAPQRAAFPHHGTAEAGPDGWLTRGEVAQQLRVSEATVARLAAAGDLEEVRVSPRSPRIRPESVEQHVARNSTRAAMAGSAA